MRREIRRICGFDVSDRWINLFRKKHGIRYFSGRRHADKKDKTIILSALDVTKMKTTNFLKKRRILRTSRKEYADVDLQVNKEIVRRQNKGERLTNPWIKEYAQYVAYQLHPEIPDIAKFFDANWLYRFKRRYCVELKPRSPEENTRSTPQTTSNEDIKSSATSMEVVTSPNYLFPHHYFNLFDQNGCGASIVKQEPTREN
ncbi:HTH CENPB-type domain-containing protein [Caenorhabditis elegans]|nr:HTH CENPB-type domain-containing protein [Caenorhabditis elegans]CAQ35050.1 HTH CENPB-type domain-containing protein [Caenorhabditis elegans]|eukprot:NP_001122492.1 Uncharacterized protein CELE_K04G2.7 [Caenorhabditis elegans]